MAVKLNRIVRLLNSELKVRSVPDRSRNGLQIRASDRVSEVGLATDASMDTFRKAARLGCDLLVVHHGLLWKGQKDIAGLTKRRIAFLKKYHISLYAVHLPLDKSLKYGHNAYLLRLADAERTGRFGDVGYAGTFESPRSVGSVARNIERGLHTKCMVWRFGKGKVKSVAAASGAGSSEIPEAIRRKMDLLITGEVFSWAYNDAKEGRLNVIIAGHYKTETSGVKALGALLKREFGLKTVFIDVPTGM